MGLETTARRPGGLNRYLESLLAAQRRGGLDATALVLGDPARDGASPEGVVAVVTPGGSLASGAWAIDRAARRLARPDVADLHFAGTASIVATVGALRATPTVVHFQGPWADESVHAGAGNVNAATKRVVERAVYRRADRCIVLTSAFSALLQDRYGVAPWAIDVVAPGVDLERFTPGSREAARASVGVGEGRVVLAVRRLVPRMGLEVLLEAWAKLGAPDGDVLAVVGDGPAGPQLARLAGSLGIADTVRFCGRVDDDELVGWYRAADLTVVPTVALEGFGLVVLESLACGTPVVGTDAGGLAEALAVAGQGPAVPAGDPAALAEAIRRALAAPQDFAARAVRRSVAEEHGWDTVAARHAAIYSSVLGGHERPRVVVLDHTAVLSGGELAIARAIGGVGDRAQIHVILGEEGPLRTRLEHAGATVEVLPLAASVRTMHRDAVDAGRLSPSGALATARYVVTLARRLRALRPDVVHTNSLKAALYGGVAARLARVPCVWHVRDRLAPPSLPPRAARLARLAARTLPTVIVANSVSTLETVGVAGGHVLASPLDPAIRPSTRAHDPAAATRFAIVGRLAPWKGQHLAIEAFADAFGDGDEVLHVLGAPLFGEGDVAAALAALAERRGVGERVVVRGFVDDVAGELAATDVLIHASTEPEPFGQVVIEAMGAGCAVVVADAGGPAEVVTDGVDGVLYPMGDRAALAVALRRLAGDAELRARLGVAAARTAAAYTPDALAPGLLAVWAEARGRLSRRGVSDRRG
ncbi:MAG TPA: glycosyltransferase [Acidimicrobiales bacterium]|nr:glycosyltransferase [Acidimicrobiales bacterium]